MLYCADDTFLLFVIELPHIGCYFCSLAYVGSSSSTSTGSVAEEDSVEVRIIAGATVAVVVLLVGIIIMTVVFLRRCVACPPIQELIRLLKSEDKTW